MTDAGRIIAGLFIIIFLGLMASPILYNAAIGNPDHKPDPKLPAQEKKCVGSKEFMVASHMTLLNEWRDKVVREGTRVYESESGMPYEASLSEGCMKCHTSKKDFCDQCHNYVDVSPYCWDCHVEPKENK